MNDLRLAIRISLVYAAIGCAWILVSDWLSFASASVVPAYWTEAVKGVAFVLVTAVLLFWMIRRNAKLLCESEDRIRLLIENAPDGVLVEAQGRIVYVNKTLLHLVGVESSQNFLGREISELIQGSALKAIRQRLTQVEQLKLPLKAQDISFQRIDGKSVNFEVSAVPVKYGAEEGALIFIRDTTDRAKYHERQLSKQRVDTIRKLAGGLAHDLNNLLQVINGYSDLACETVPEGDEVRSHLEQIRISGKRASELVEKLLAFSRSKDPNEKWCDLNGTSVIPKGDLPLVSERVEVAARVEKRPAPPAEKTVQAVAAPPVKDTVKSGCAVLIAEDDEMVRNLSSRILKRDGFIVIEAEDGDEAVRLYQENAAAIAVVILDVVMPHMDGFQAHDQIRALNSSVPILFASGYSGIDTPSNVTLEPGVNLLQKPFDVEVLLSTVRRVAKKVDAVGLA